MSKLQTFLIGFEETDTFFSGQWINGKVFVSLSEAMKIRNIRVRFYGEARCKWMDGQSKYFGTEVCLDNSFVLWGQRPGNSDDCSTLEAGDHEFPFRCHLPYSLE